MAIVVDAARMNQADTQQSMRFMQFFAGAAETHIPARGDAVPWAGVDNTGDAWLPQQTTQDAP